jgi:hypothetical protein
MKDDYLLKKIEASHSAIAKTVSDFGDKVNKTNLALNSVEIQLSDFIERIDKKMDSHDDSIRDLNEAKTTIFTSVKVTRLVAGSLIGVIIVMGGFIISTWSTSYNDRLDKIELDRKETLEKVLQMLNDKKNYLNYNQKETIKDIFANL